MPDFILSPQAEADMEEIGRYTQEHWDIRQRNEYLGKIDSRFQWITENLKLGKSRDEIKEGYFSYDESSHVIYYRINKNRVQIIRILHKSMEPKLHL